MKKDRIVLIQEDITTLDCDVIVNAANNQLIPGGGVDGAIHRAGGPSIEEECRVYTRQSGDLPTGQVMITHAGKLPCKWIIHTVGPRVYGALTSKDEELLESAYWNALSLAVEKDLKTIAFPNISTGIYGFPKREAALIVVDTVKRFLRESEAIETVYFVCHDQENYDLYRRLL